jgi:hypothetical protein
MKAKPGEAELAQMLAGLGALCDEVGRDDDFAALCFTRLLEVEAIVERKLAGEPTRADRATWLELQRLLVDLREKLATYGRHKTGGKIDGLSEAYAIFANVDLREGLKRVDKEITRLTRRVTSKGKS